MTHHATCRPARRVAARKRLPSCDLVGVQCCKPRFQNAMKTVKPHFHRSQQYSIVALTNSSGAITERFSYSAYVKPVFCNTSGTDISASAKDNRILYTGREWDEELKLHHFRARLYDPGVGRFLGRDPIGFASGIASVYQYANGNPAVFSDWTGLYSMGYPGHKPSNVSADCESALDLFAEPYQASAASWTSVDLPEIIGSQAFGYTAICVDLDCSCKKCETQNCQCDPGDRFAIHCTLKLTFHIFMDRKAIERNGVDIDRVYGHEQRHINSYLFFMRSYLERQNSREGHPGQLSSLICLDESSCDSESAERRQKIQDSWDSIKRINQEHSWPGHGPLGPQRNPQEWPFGVYPSLGGIPSESNSAPQCAVDKYNEMMEPFR